jgi:hypothetical protein
MSERGFDMRRNGVGILLFGVGVFFAVLLVKAFTSEVPVAEAGGTAALAALWIDSLGGIAGFVFCGGIAILGARMFLDAASGNALRHAGGLAGVAVGISIVAGSVSAGAGGALGRAIGGGISSATHVAIGTLVGIGVLAFAVWAVWLQDARIDRTHLDREIEDDGVTADEAAALIPTESNRTLAESRKTERVSTWTAPVSPYPEDVRRRGEIPAGAKPLDPTQHAHTSSPSGQSGTQTSSVYRWTAARTDEPADSAGEDLARAIATAPHVEPIEEADLDLDVSGPFAQALTAEERVDEEPTEEGDELAEAELDEELLEVRALDVEVLEDEPLDRIAETPAPQAERLPDIPRPSWEQSSLFEEADEPVDAYGTPLALVDEVVERLREGESAAEVEVRESVAAVVDTRAAVDDDSEDDEESDEDEEDEDDEYESDDEDSESDEDDDADEDEEEEDDEVAAEAYAEDDPENDGEEAEEAEEEHEAEVTGREESLREPALAKSAPAPATDVRLKDVVLTPQVAASPRTPSAPALPADRQKLLVDAGCLFVDNGRVAVSMLQRQYSMDFDDACKVLDELQEMGLIGPYLGGQRRDILLTRDQWLERVASS